ncbi:hypothetical protein NX059_007813 [Plenodomus lindquistii]|nr:hypothetical protein NX059_007813 [Plenodomus lindquistii]
MTVFPSKDSFFRLGVHLIAPSTSHASQDCFVCKHPLAIHPPSRAKFLTSHLALRIIRCGHVLGVDCLGAWIETSNTCPICARMLFENNTHAITQEDVNAIVNALGHVCSERRIMHALARCMQKQDRDEVQMRRGNEESMRRDAQAEAERRNAFGMTEADWEEIDADMGGDDDDDENFDPDAVFGVDDEDNDGEL